MDRLSLWAAAARAEGMRYGDWVAKYHPPDAQGRKPAYGQNPSEYTGQKKRPYCVWCGREISPDIRSRKYCGPDCAKKAQAEQVRLAYHRKKALWGGDANELEK